MRKQCYAIFQLIFSGTLSIDSQLAGQRKSIGNLLLTSDFCQLLGWLKRTTSFINTAKVAVFKDLYVLYAYIYILFIYMYICVYIYIYIIYIYIFVYLSITHKIFETNSSFHFLFFKSFLLVLTKLSFWQGEWALGYHSMKFRQFPDIF